MDLYDIIDIKSENELELERENEIERSNKGKNKSTYINRKLINSQIYSDSFKILNETRSCTKNILISTRKMLEHHHGDEYEDLYFVDSKKNTVKARTDFTAVKLKTYPTNEMKDMYKNSPHTIICIHNHPNNSLPSFSDVMCCLNRDYKYGLIACHNGSIYKYETLGEINKVIYNAEIEAYKKEEYRIKDEYKENNKNFYLKMHNKNFDNLHNHLLDANVNIEEVLWNENYN